MSNLIYDKIKILFIISILCNMTGCHQIQQSSELAIQKPFISKILTTYHLIGYFCASKDFKSEADGSSGLIIAPKDYSGISKYSYATQLFGHIYDKNYIITASHDLNINHPDIQKVKCTNLNYPYIYEFNINLTPFNEINSQDENYTVYKREYISLVQHINKYHSLDIYIVRLPYYLTPGKISVPYNLKLTDEQINLMFSNDYIPDIINKAKVE